MIGRRATAGIQAGASARSARPFSSEAAFLRGLDQLEIEAPIAGEWLRIGELVEEYADLGLGGTDASVVALAERLDARTVITLDRRHFTVVRPRHCDALELLPA